MLRVLQLFYPVFTYCFDCVVVCCSTNIVTLTHLCAFYCVLPTTSEDMNFLPVDFF